MLKRMRARFKSDIFPQSRRVTTKGRGEKRIRRTQSRGIWFVLEGKGTRPYKVSRVLFLSVNDNK